MKYAGTRIVVSPTDRAHAGNQPEPVHKQNENENRSEKPKRFPDEFTPDDIFEEIVETLDEPFPKILKTSRNRFDVAGRKLCKNDDSSRYDPSHQHRVSDRELSDLNQLR